MESNLSRVVQNTHEKKARHRGEYNFDKDWVSYTEKSQYGPFSVHLLKLIVLTECSKIEMGIKFR